MADPYNNPLGGGSIPWIIHCTHCGFYQQVNTKPAHNSAFICGNCLKENRYVDEEKMSKEKKAVDDYLETVDRLEPSIHPIDPGAFYASAAISLKRIADASEAIAKSTAKIANPPMEIKGQMFVGEGKNIQDIISETIKNSGSEPR